MIDAGQILYEDNHLIAINKISGQISQGDKTGDSTLADEIKEYIKVRDHKPGNVFCGVIHRLDRPVSGVILFAKTSKALSRMTKQVQERSFHKVYWAVTKNNPPQLSAHLTDYLVKNESQNRSYVVPEGTKNSKRAELQYRQIAISKGGYHLLEVELFTGRHHQIRCQLANIGCPIKGDLKYGAARSNTDGGITLHARSLSFRHPTTQQPITIVAPNSEIETMFDI